jgi:hypothetical protein
MYLFLCFGPSHHAKKYKATEQAASPINTFMKINSLQANLKKYK